MKLMNDAGREFNNLVPSPPSQNLLNDESSENLVGLNV